MFSSLLSDFLFGGVAGIVATMCCHPLDVIRTRFVSQGEPKVKRLLPLIVGGNS